MKFSLRAAAWLAAGLPLLFAAPAMASDGAVYTQTNAVGGNAVHRLDRGPDGLLTPVATYRTGGAGTGAGLGSQGAVALSDDGRRLVAVNAGSNDISSFRVSRRGHLTLIDRVASGGVAPNSVDIAGDSVYVLNAGNVTGFDLDGSGRLRLRGSSSPPMAASPTPATRPARSRATRSPATALWPS
jgi:6-phosphogluconolactonase